MHLGLMDRPFVPDIRSRELRSLTKVTDGPQAHILNVPQFQEIGAQACMSERGQGLTFTKNVGRGFLLHPTPSTHWNVYQPQQVKMSSQGVVSS
jgi:hypothetical protein